MSSVKKLTVTPSPHTKSPTTVSGIMLDVIIALIPCVFAGIAVFGYRAALVISACVICCVGFEYGIRRLLQKEETIGDLTAVITGLLLSFALPVTAPLWICILGSFIAIVIVKLMLGGVGKNPVNPALTARAALFIAFTGTMTDFTVPARRMADAVSSATPLSYLSSIDLSGDISAEIGSLVSDGRLPGMFNMLFGVRAGCIGEVCSVAILLGGIYLILRGVISIAIPGTFILTTGVITLLASRFNLPYTAYSLLGGGLLLAAFFMATDYTTSPVSTKGKLLYGTLCGLITAILRLFSPLEEGVTVAILLMNLAAPLIDKFIAPAYFGKIKMPKNTPAFITEPIAAYDAAEAAEEPAIEAVEEAAEEPEEPAIEEVKKAAEEPEDPAIEEVEKAVEEPEEPAIEEVEEPAIEEPEEPAIEEVEEAVEEPEGPAIEAVEEAVEEPEDPAIEEVEKAVEEPEEPAIEEVEEPAIEEVEEAAEEPEAKPVRSVRLVDEIAPSEDDNPAISRHTGRQRRRPEPAPAAYPKKKNKKSRGRAPVNIDIDTPLPDVIPAFLRKDIEKNRQGNQQ